MYDCAFVYCSMNYVVLYLYVLHNIPCTTVPLLTAVCTINTVPLCTAVCTIQCLPPCNAMCTMYYVLLYLRVLQYLLHCCISVYCSIYYVLLYLRVLQNGLYTTDLSAMQYVLCTTLPSCTAVSTCTAVCTMYKYISMYCIMYYLLLYLCLLQ